MLLLCFLQELQKMVFHQLKIDGKPLFEVPVKKKDKAYEAIIEMRKNNDYTTGNLLDYEYFSKHYKLIANCNRFEQTS